MKFRDILSEYNVPIAPEGQEHCRTGWINIDCPYCGKDSSRYHLGYSIEGNYLSCWQCGSHPLINTVIEITGLSYREAKKLLSELEVEHFEKQKLLGILSLPSGIKPLLSAHKKYLHSRRFNWQKIERLWGICGIGIASKLKWRIFIPIYYHGDVVSWTSRTISSNPKITRYISAGENEEAMPHKELLYGEDFARQAIIVTEGVFDAWRIGQGAVAIFGLSYSSEQLLKMSKYPIRAICFDNEPEAQKRAKQLVNDLSVFPGDTYNVILDMKDAAEESRANIKRLRKEILE